MVLTKEDWIDVAGRTHGGRVNKLNGYVQNDTEIKKIDIAASNKIQLMIM